MREELKASMGPIEFSDLRPHLARGAVIIVAPPLDLLDVGEALARDDKTRVAAWIEQGLLTKPSVEDLQRWSNGTAPAQLLTSLVVQPFVLVREGGPAIGVS